MFQKTGLMTVAVLAMLVLNGCDLVTASDSSLEERLFYRGSELTIDNPNGSITVKRGQDNELVIDLERVIKVYRGAFSDLDPENYLDDLTVLIEGDEEAVTITAEYPENTWPNRVFPEVNMVITAPVDTILNIDQGNGPIEILELESAMTLKTGNGAITCSDVAGKLTLETGNGAIAVDHPIELLESEAIACVTGNGAIAIGLPEDSAFDLTAKTGTGDIDASDFDVEAGGFVSREINEAVNGGGAAVSADTGNGVITVASTGEAEMRETLTADAETLAGFWAGAEAITDDGIRFLADPYQEITGWKWDNAAQGWYENVRGVFDIDTTKAAGSAEVIIERVYNPETDEYDDCPDCAETLSFEVLDSYLKIVESSSVYFAEGIYLREEAK
jgi:hypothetical protein